jgi:hypothetical protein
VRRPGQAPAQNAACLGGFGRPQRLRDTRSNPRKMHARHYDCPHFAVSHLACCPQRGAVSGGQAGSRSPPKVQRKEVAQPHGGIKVRWFNCWQHSWGCCTLSTHVRRTYTQEAQALISPRPSLHNGSWMVSGTGVHWPSCLWRLWWRLVAFDAGALDATPIFGTVEGRSGTSWKRSPVCSAQYPYCVHATYALLNGP